MIWQSKSQDLKNPRFFGLRLMSPTLPLRAVDGVSLEGRMRPGYYIIFL